MSRQREGAVVGIEGVFRGKAFPLKSGLPASLHPSFRILGPQILTASEESYARSSPTNWFSKLCLSGQSLGPVSSRLGKAGFMVYCSAAHRVREDRVRTLIGLTTLSGLTTPRVRAGEPGRDENTGCCPAVQLTASFMSH